ncbi:MAG TPA: serine hydrolase [Myxococcota bacterium]
MASGVLALALMLSSATFAAKAPTKSAATTTKAAAKATTSHPFAGDWQGQVDVPGSPLVLTIHIADAVPPASPVVTLDIPAQNTKGQVLQTVVLDVDKQQAKVGVVGNGDPTWSGTISGDTWKGTFTQGKGSLPFSLTRVRKDVVAKQRLEGLDKAIESARALANIPGIGVGVVVDDKIVWAKGFGLRDVKAKLPVTPQTLFMIGSTTKAFTNVALGTLQEEGALSLSDRVRQHLPAFDLVDDRDDHVTLNDLAMHATGIERGDLIWILNQPKTRAEVLKSMSLLKAEKPVGEAFIYNNWMYATLGMVIEDKTKLTYPEAMKRRVLAPLGMTNTSMELKALTSSKNKALAYERVDNGVEVVPYHDNMHFAAAGSATSSSIDDMNRWLRFQLGDGSLDGKRVLKATTMAALHQPERLAVGKINDVDEPVVGYGMGWGGSSWRGHARLGHGGGVDGFLTQVTVLPNDGIGVVVVQNTTHASLGTAITDTILEALLELPTKNSLETSAKNAAEAFKKPADDNALPPVIAKVGTKPAHPLKDYAGTFTTASLPDTVVTVAADGAMTIRFGGNGPHGVDLGVTHAHYETFTVSTVSRKDMLSFWKKAAFTFTTNIDGDVDGIEALVPTLGTVTFKQKTATPTKATLEKLAGTYAMGDFKVAVAMVDGLQLSVPGQPTYALKHERALRFSLNLEGFFVTFVVDGDGVPKGIVLEQPQGTVRLNRVP